MKKMNEQIGMFTEETKAQNNQERIIEMKRLIDILNEAALAYYQEAREIMPNFEYDRLYDRLEELEKETGVIMSGSPTQRVGYEVLSELPKEAHACRHRGGEEKALIKRGHEAEVRADLLTETGRAQAIGAALDEISAPADIAADRRKPAAGVQIGRAHV